MDKYMKRKIKGKKLLGSGGTRVVYDLGGGSVMKIAKSKKGIQCNRMEANLYTTTRKSLKKYLARVTDFDPNYRWIAMKKYRGKFPNTVLYRRELMKIVKQFMAHGIIPSRGVGHYENPYAPNLRIKPNKQIVVIDYGGFK
jgi:hypothetical protein